MTARLPGAGGRRHRGGTEARPPHPIRPPAVPAWHLTEGSVLPGPARVLLVDRDPVRRTVQVLTDAPGAARTTHHADDPVDVVTLIQ